PRAAPLLRQLRVSRGRWLRSSTSLPPRPARCLPLELGARYCSGLHMTSEASQPDPPRAVAASKPAAGLAALARAFAAAALFLGGWRRSAAAALTEGARGPLFFPFIGLGVGLAVGLAAAAAAAWVAPALIAPLVVALLLALQRGAPARAVLEAV